MTFFNSLWRWLGFGQDDADGLLNDTDTGETPRDPAPAPAPSAADPAPAGPLEFDAAVKGRMFDNILNVFNAALPDFLSRSIDPAAQRKALEDALDESVTAYIDSLEQESARRAEARLRAAADASKAESERLAKEMERLEQQKAKLHEQQLSADRQLRALKDRSRDLETQVDRLEAEREQYQIENSSLANKLKLAQVQPEVIEQLQAEIARLRSGQAEPAEAPALADLQAAHDSLEKEMATERAARAELQASLAAREEALAKAEALLEQARHDMEDKEKGVAVATGLYNDAAQELTAERERHAQARQELDQARSRIEELTEVAEWVDKISGQLAQVEEVIAKRDERISRLKASNRKLKAELAELRDSRLRQRAAADLFSLNEGESINIEEDMECPEWFVASPGQPLQREPNQDFGYTEPPRKPKAPDSDAQMPLF